MDKINRQAKFIQPLLMWPPMDRLKPCMSSGSVMAGVKEELEGGKQDSDH